MGNHSNNIIADSLISLSTHNADGEFFIYGNKRYTYGKVVPRVLKIAQALIKLGVKKDDKVAFMFHNSPEFIEVNCGIQVAGAVPTPMNYRYVASEIEFQGQHSDAKVLIYDSIWAETVEPAIQNLTGIEHFVCFGKSDNAQVTSYDDFLNSGESKDPTVATDWEDVAVMIYTGGTTGLPKGVMLTYDSYLEMFSLMLAQVVSRSLSMDMTKERHKKMVDAMPIPGKGFMGPILRLGFVKNYFKKPSTIESLKKKFYKQFSDPDTAKKDYKDPVKSMYPSMPFFHVSAYTNLLLGELSGRFCYVLPESPSFDPAKILDLIQREQVGGLTNVPTGWKKLLSFPEFDNYDVQSVKTVTTGGGRTPAALKSQIMEKFPNAMLIDTFGQTEMAPVTSFRIDVDSEKIVDRSVGKAIVESKIVDNDGNEVPQGEPGEILYRSKTMMKGYYKDKDNTESAFADGWFKSGDLGYFDENGEIRTIDRKKECINTGGEKVYPLEVEEIIQTHPKVDYACVLGVPDEEWGSRVRVVIQPLKGAALNAEEISEFCRGKMAGYKIPRSIIIIDELPFSPAGKLLRKAVKEAHGKADA